MMYLWIQGLLMALAFTLFIGCVVSFLVFLWADSLKAGMLSITFVVLGMVTAFIGLVHCIIG